MTDKVLIVGSGGREHALAWKLAQSPHVEQIFVAPGNGGTVWKPEALGADTASCENVALGVTDFSGLIDFAQTQHIALTVVGPEVPLAAGVGDAFAAARLRAFAPVQATARLEASKAYARDLMAKLEIPSPVYRSFTDTDAACAFVREFARPVVVKADGLAAGKGVFVTDTVAEAEAAITGLLNEGTMGDAGNTIVVEERIEGDEISVLAFCDGKVAVPMRVARDHKRALDGDKGPNTGGMGAFAPAPDVTDDEIQYTVNTILQPIVDAARESGQPYNGVLYAGLMRTADGIRVLEFNCRFGDPETQVVLPLLRSDLYEILNACVDGTLGDLTLDWYEDACATVVLSSPGYPDSYPKGLPITINAANLQSTVFHAGTRHSDGQLVTSGGRVLGVTARAATLAEALDTVYSDIDSGLVSFANMHFRTDIGSGYRE